MRKLTTRITAMLLAGMLVIGSVPGSVLAASTDVDPDQTSEIVEEVYEDESSSFHLHTLLLRSQMSGLDPHLLMPRERCRELIL